MKPDYTIWGIFENDGRWWDSLKILKSRDKIKILVAMKALIYAQGKYNWKWGMCMAFKNVTDAYGTIHTSDLAQLGLIQPTENRAFNTNYWYEIDEMGHKQRIEQIDRAIAKLKNK